LPLPTTDANMSAEAENEELLEYDEEEAEQTETAVAAAAEDGESNEKTKGSYVSIHSSGFRDFLLKPEILRAIVDCGFEHPSQVQNDTIPPAIVKTDIICQAKSGMGKTAVFVIATLQQLEPVDGEVHVLAMCHTRELAFQINKEYERFSKYFTGVKTMVIIGGMDSKVQERQLKEETPHIVVGTPGRVLALARNGALDLSNLKHFVLDECDQMLEKEGANSNLPPVRATAFCNSGMHHNRRAGAHAPGGSPSRHAGRCAADLHEDTA